MLRRANTPGVGLQRMLAVKFQETTMTEPTGTRDQQDGDLV